MKKIIAVLMMSVMMLCSISLTVFAESEKIDVWVNTYLDYNYSTNEEAEIFASLAETNKTANKNTSAFTYVWDLSNIAKNLYLIQTSYNDTVSTTNKMYYKNWYLAYISSQEDGNNSIEVIDTVRTSAKITSIDEAVKFKKQNNVYKNNSESKVDTAKYPVIIYDSTVNMIYGISKNGLMQFSFTRVGSYYDGCSYEVATMSDISSINKFNYFTDGSRIEAANADDNINTIIYNDDNTIRSTYITQLVRNGDTNSGEFAERVITDELVELLKLYNNHRTPTTLPQRIGYLAKVTCISVDKDSGIRNIAAVKEADTVPHQNSVNFNDDEIPLAYDLKSGVVDEDKLSEDLKARFKNIEDSSNAILLPKIVFIKGSGSKTITYKTGQTFKDSNSYTDSSMGGSITAKITNAGVFTYTCSNTSALQAGTYNKQYVFDDKTVYVQVIVLAQPSANTSVTINF